MTATLDLNATDRAIVAAILRDTLPAEAKVWVFGSRAKGRARRGSDLDLAIDAGRPLTRAEENTLADQFHESDLSYTVDVVDLQTVAETFRAIIERDRVPFGDWPSVCS